MRSAKVFRVNGALYAANSYSKRLIRSCLSCSGGFLSFTVLANDLKKYNIGLKLVGGES